MTFTIPGRPVACAGRVIARGGQLYRYPSPASEEYQARVRACWRSTGRPPWPEDQPLSMSITVCYSIPPSTGKKERARMAGGLHLPARRPDADSIAGLLCTALAGLAFSDQRQIARLEVIKRFVPGPPRVTVELLPLRPHPPFPQGCEGGGCP